MSDIAFFSARKKQLDYFSKINQKLINKGVVSHVFSHKKIPLLIDLFALKKIPFNDINQIIDYYLKEKKNARKHQKKTALYWSIFSFTKKLETIFLYLRYLYFLKQQKISILVMWNGLKYRQQVIKLVASQLDIKTYFMENGLVPNMTTIDPIGINYLNSLPRDKLFYIQHTETINHRKIEPYRYDLTTERPKSLPERYIFVPLQVNTDSQIIHFSPWIKNAQSLIAIMVAVANRIPNEIPHILIKPHPAGDEDISELQAMIKHANKIQIVNEINTMQLIEHAEAIITINSTVGIEALLLNKKVITLGLAFYNIEDLTLHAENINELISYLKNIDQWQLDPIVHSGFIDYLVNQYQIEGNWNQTNKAHIEKISEKLISFQQQNQHI